MFCLRAVLLTLLIQQSQLLAQQTDCRMSIAITIRDSLSGESIYGIRVTSTASGKTAATDSAGRCTLHDNCPGETELIFTGNSHKGKRTIVFLNSDTTLLLFLMPKTYFTEKILVEAQIADGSETNATAIIEGKEFESKTGESLGKSLSTITGVTALNTGSSISKPIIHGLYGNRILIMNNGVRLEGQQWGSEHAPEIDPMIGRRLQVIKGASTIRYGPDAIAGVILVDPNSLPYGGALSGEMDIAGFSNGLEGFLSGFIESGFTDIPQLSLRAQGTLKKAGNVSAPSYTLKNTGYEEANFSLAGGYRSNAASIEAYYGSFSSKIGIFSGSHIGNLSDLEIALNSPVPFDTGSFSYDIGNPYQDVQHRMLKLNGYYLASPDLILKADYAYQQNDRREYDLHSSYNNPGTPELFFSISTHTLDLVSESKFSKDLSSEAGVSGITQTNVGKGRPFIPNFQNYGLGLFNIQKYYAERFLVEAGLRYDYKWQRIYAYEGDSLVSAAQEYSNLSAKAGVVYDFRNGLSAALSLGTAWRPPSINELYSDGLHHGSARIEIGDPDLLTEVAFNASITLDYDNGKDIHAEASLYTYQINNYVFLEPRLPPTLTIRGAFPTFYYSQGDSYINGLDFELDYSPFRFGGFVSKISLLRAFNKSADDYLAMMPPDRFETSVYFTPGDLSFIRNTELRISAVTVLEQTRVPETDDYAPPPGGYNIYNALFSTDIDINDVLLSIVFKADNIFDKGYRDYLNRFRYYTDEMGRNISLKLILPFSVTKP